VTYTSYTRTSGFGVLQHSDSAAAKIQFDLIKERTETLQRDRCSGCFRLLTFWWRGAPRGGRWYCWSDRAMVCSHRLSRQTTTICDASFDWGLWVPSLGERVVA